MDAEEPNKVILYIKKKGYYMDEMVGSPLHYYALLILILFTDVG